jgi:dTDP-3-amino-3,4,6-trideoxy-alpha-D-glucose transaminase
MIPFNVLKPLHRRLSAEIEAAVQRVMESGWYVLGPELETFERSFAEWHGVAHAVGVASGTDALELALRAAGIGPGDEVITVSHTAIATVCAVERAGATPVVVDVEADAFTMSVDAARAAITPRTRVLLPVHLYGHPANINELSRLAADHNLVLIEDCAQAHGARLDGKLVGTFGSMGAFSFYPTKNLGAYGDGGAIITNDNALADRLRRLRFYGQTAQYHCIESGINSRLDEVQAAILSIKLKHLREHTEERRQIASWYRELTSGVELPIERAGAFHVYHLFVVRHPDRDHLREALKSRGIGTAIHYPVPVHLQPGYARLGMGRGSLPLTERLSHEILSLPMYVGLTKKGVEEVSAAIGSITEITATHAS